MSLTVYLYPKCGTCRAAMKSLEQKGVRPDRIVNLYETAPDQAELKEIIRKSGLGVKSFFNTSGTVYKEMKLKDKLPNMTEEEMIALLASDGRLIKRPIVYDGNRVTVGYNEKQFAEVWGK